MTRLLRFAPAVLALAACTLLPPQAFAVNKEMIQLQTQIQQLQDAVARLQQSNDERMGVMRDLVQQTADSVNKMSTTVDGLQRKLQSQTEGETGKLDQVSGQVQSLNDSVDELKARLARMEKSLGDLQNSQQSINSHLTDGSGSSTTPPPSVNTAPPTNDSTPPAPTPRTRGGKPSAAIAPADPAPTAAPAAPPVADLYQTAFGDYNGAKYALATAEFNDVIKLYPDSTLAGNSYFYLGEIEYKAGKFGPASQNYDHVIEQYPGNSKIPTAQLRKGQSLFALKQTDAATREMRSLIGRYPNSPEAAQARNRLNALGIVITPRRSTQ